MNRLVHVGIMAGWASSLALGLAGCGHDPQQPGVAAQAILGGRETSACEWPAVVSIGGCSGVLVHPQLVLYAAHCGTATVDVLFGTRADQPRLVAKTNHCRAIDGARLGDGSDLAYCVLEEPVTAVEPARVVSGCELNQLTAGSPAVLVGFGREGAEGDSGTQRVGASRIGAVGDELLLDGEGVDTCFGDSGGPLFILVETAEGLVVPRVAGITSAGSEDTCGSGTSHYVDLASKIEWIEAASGLDITPCFDGSDWAPTPECVEVASWGGSSEEIAAAIAAGSVPSSSGSAAACGEAAPPALSATCGAAFDAPVDAEAPSLVLTSPGTANIEHWLGANEDYLELEVRAEAWDDGWGVQAVTFTLWNSAGSVDFERVDQVPPYDIPTFRVPPGSFVLSIQAADYAGNVAEQAIAIDVVRERGAVSGGACSVVGPGGTPTVTASVLMLLMLVGSYRRRSRACRDSSCSQGLSGSPYG